MDLDLDVNGRELDVRFWVKICFVVFLGLSIVDDVPKVDRSGIVPEAVNGECKSLDSGVICFDTWKVLGFDTGLVTGVFDFGGFGKDFSSFVFVRESDFIINKEWSESSRLISGNYSGELPDLNVSYVGVE